MTMTHKIIIGVVALCTLPFILTVIFNLAIVAIIGWVGVLSFQHVTNTMKVK